jgi:uncharacterized protein
MGGIRNLFGLQPKNYGEYYIYALRDPRTNKPFYIGKGSHDRMYQHMKDMRRLIKKGTPGSMMALSCKHKRIIEILDAGYADIDYEILYQTDEEGAAYRAERQYIADYGLERLTNEVYGLSDRAIDRLIKRRLTR